MPAAPAPGAGWPRRSRLLAALLAGLVVLPGCSIRRLALKSMAAALAGGGAVFASDDDPQLVREAAPFALKTYESLLLDLPEHRGLLVATAQGFVQYAYAFIQSDAERMAASSIQESLALRRRARRLFLRGRDYALRELELRRPGIRDALRRGSVEELARLDREAVPALYWAAAGWGGAIAVLKDDPELIGDLGTVKGMVRRVLELDQGFELGAAHEMMVSLEAGLAGGSLERAREHYELAVAASRGLRASPHVTCAESVAVRRQDRKLFDTLIERALAVDPDREPGLRLANLLSQERARWLRSRAAELFFE